MRWNTCMLQERDRGLKIQAQPGLHRKFYINLRHTLRSRLKNKKTNPPKQNQANNNNNKKPR